MKASYDPRTDILTLLLKDNASVAESDEDKPGVILDYDDRGDLVSMEILDASQRVTEATKMEFQGSRSPDICLPSSSEQFQGRCIPGRADL